MNVTANPSATNYQWQMAIATVGVYSNVPAQPPFSGSNAATLNITNVPDTLNGYVFKCVVTGGLCPSATSGEIPFTVLTSPVFTEVPDNDTIVYGYAAHFHAKASTNDVVFYWQAGADGVNFYNINNNSLYQGVTTADLDVFAGWPLNNWWFRCIIKSTNPSCGIYHDTSNAAQVIIRDPNNIKGIANGSKVNYTVYPNPASGSELFVQADQTVKNALQSKIIDKLGRVLYDAELNLSKNKVVPVSITQLPPGIYTLQLTDADGNVSNVNFTRQ
jgi:hypothetical protein